MLPPLKLGQMCDCFDQQSMAEVVLCDFGGSILKGLAQFLEHQPRCKIADDSGQPRMERLVKAVP